MDDVDGSPCFDDLTEAERDGRGVAVGLSVEIVENS